MWQVVPGCYFLGSTLETKDNLMNINLINQQSGGARPLFLAVFSLLAFTEIAGAQPFLYKDSDLCLGFRKVTPYTENNEVVVNIGQASTYVNAAIGTTLPVSAFSASELAAPTFSTFNNLSWSVFGWFSVPSTNYPGYPAYTLWLTVPRTDNAVRSPDANRYGATFQAIAKGKMVSIFAGAAFISHDIGTSSTYNTPTLVRESIATYPTHLYSVWMGDLSDGTTGTLNDTWPDNNLEITTPGAFSGVVRSDLYEVRPLDDGHGGVVVDPHTGTSGLAYYVGYFEFNSNGSMTFTRQAATTTPPQVALSFLRTNNVSTISFLSSGSVTYTLFFTNSAGLGTPVSSWPSLPGTISGDGTMKSFQDTTTDAMRVYRVGAQ
jgi:hypothetical protein